MALLSFFSLRGLIGHICEGHARAKSCLSVHPPDLTTLMPPTSLPLGTDNETGLLLLSGANPRGYQNNPKSFEFPICRIPLQSIKKTSLLTEVILLRRTQPPRADWGEYFSSSSLVHGYRGILSIDPALSPKRRDFLPLLLHISHVPKGFSPLRLIILDPDTDPPSVNPLPALHPPEASTHRTI